MPLIRGSLKSMEFISLPPALLNRDVLHSVLPLGVNERVPL